jgi:hypothetical protein
VEDDGIVAALRPGDHVCAVVGGSSQRRAVLRGFVRDGIRDGHRVLCFVAAEPRGLTLAPGRPGQVRVVVRDRGEVTYRRQLELLRHEIGQADREGYAGLRGAGDMAWVLRGGRAMSDTDTRDLLDFEAAVTPLIGRGAAIGLCLYDRRHFPAPAVRAVGTVHTGTAPVEQGALLRFLFTPSGVALSGQVDESNLGALRAVLDELPSSRRTVVDAGDLRFLSAGAAAVLLQSAARARDLRVICERPVARTLTAAGAASVAGLTVQST